MLPVKAVAFDLGGVLIQINHRWEDAIRAAGESFPAVGPLGGFADFDSYQMGAVDETTFFSSLCEFIGSTDLECAKRVHMAVLREEYDGVSQLVRELTEKGITCGCLSNTNAMHWATFFDGSRYAFGPSLTVRIGSHVVKANKPDATIYRAFEQASNCTGEEIAYFDDGPANVAAAKDRGWHAWVIDPAGDTAAQMRRHFGL